MDQEESADGNAAVAKRAAEVITRQLAQALPSGLYLVATPIGNLADITLRALATLSLADVIYCEDTRHSRTLLSHFSIGRPLRPYHEHNAERERPRVLAELTAGKAIALISDAGTPLVSDPGYKLVRDCVQEGHRVVSLPGPSALLAALGNSGLPTDTFVFAGFLPHKQGARRTRLGELKDTPATLVFFEAPTRVAEALADIGAVLGERESAVARELTKMHEEMKYGTPTELSEWAARETPKGEMVVLVGPPSQREISDAEIEARLQPFLEHMGLRDAAKTVADVLGVSKSRAYDVGLAAKKAAGK